MDQRRHGAVRAMVAVPMRERCAHVITLRESDLPQAHLDEQALQTGSCSITVKIW